MAYPIQNANICSICEDDDRPIYFSTDEKTGTQILKEKYQAKILACAHVFHKQCLARHLIENNTCPNCRSLVEEKDRHFEYVKDPIQHSKLFETYIARKDGQNHSFSFSPDMPDNIKEYCLKHADEIHNRAPLPGVTWKKGGTIDVHGKHVHRVSEFDNTKKYCVDENGVSYIVDN